MCGGGGAANAESNMPEYLRWVHQDALVGARAQVGDDTAFGVQVPLFDLINDAVSFGANPFLDASAYDPTARLLAMQRTIAGVSGIAEEALLYIQDSYSDLAKTVAELEGVVLPEISTLADVVLSEIDPALKDDIRDIGTDVWEGKRVDLMDSVLRTTCLFEATALGLDFVKDWKLSIHEAGQYIDAAIMNDQYLEEDTRAFRALSEEKLYQNDLPAFRSGMRNVGAVSGSAFQIGQALLLAAHERDISKHQSELRLSMHRQRNDMIQGSVQMMINALMQKTEFLKILPGLYGSAFELSTNASRLRTDIENLQGTLSLEYQRLLLNRDESQAKLSIDKFSAFESAVIKRVAIELEKVSGRIQISGFRLEISKLLTTYVQMRESLARLSLDTERIALIAEQESLTAGYDLKEREMLWPFQVYQYGANMIAAYSGGVSVPDTKGPTKMQTALGGALSGAAIGTQVSPGIGTAIGAVAGGLAGYLTG